jgi:hypothetical protein
MQTKTVPCPERVCSISLMFGVINYTYTGVDICINRLSTAPRCESSIIFCMTTKHTQKQLFLIASLVFQCKIWHRFWHYLPSKVTWIKNLPVVWWFDSKSLQKYHKYWMGLDIFSNCPMWHRCCGHCCFCHIQCCRHQFNSISSMLHERINIQELVFILHRMMFLEWQRQYHEKPWETMRNHEKPWETMQYHDISWDILSYHEMILWYFMRYHEIS